MSPVCLAPLLEHAVVFFDRAVGPESIVIRGNRVDALVQYQEPVSQLSLARTFAELSATWKADSASKSSIDEIVLHPAYQRIIGLGPAAIPLIAEELRREPHHWFNALIALTGANPVAAEPRGDVDAMSADWLAWLLSKGY